jgi:ankyrin repeat protein
LTMNDKLDIVAYAVRGDVDAVRKWLYSGGRFDLNKQATVLSRAATRGHTDICQLVIECGTVSAEDLVYILRSACFRGHLSLVQLIVSTLGHHYDSQLLHNCLHLAAIRCHTEVVNWLLPLTNPTDADYVRYNLVLTSARGDLTHVTQLVIKIGPNATDEMSHALLTACCWGRVEIVDWLMTHTSADVNYSRAIDNEIMTSLATACYEGHMTVANRLLTDATSQCDVNMVTGVKCNAALHNIIWHTRPIPLHELCYSGDTAAVVNVVYECDVNVQDNNNGRSAMHYACMNGNLDIVKVLLSAFADTNIADDDGMTPAAACEYYSNQELANYIQHSQRSHSSDDGDYSVIVADQTYYITSTTRTDNTNNTSKHADTEHKTSNKTQFFAFDYCCNII